MLKNNYHETNVMDSKYEKVYIYIYILGINLIIFLFDYAKNFEFHFF